MLAVAGAAVIVSAGLGTRLGLWDFRIGFSVLRYGAWIAIGAGALSAWAMFVTRPGGTARGIRLASAGLVIAAVAAGVPLSWLVTARTVPPIHDISTDLQNPPEFVAVLPLRREAPNPATYGGPDVAAQQRAAYPDVKSLLLPVAAAEAFDQALSLARIKGWEIVAADPATGRIEATDTTLWFGFKDDIVIRVTPVTGGARIDVRSVSRVGRSDVGTNARRIKTFLTELAR